MLAWWEGCLVMISLFVGVAAFVSVPALLYAVVDRYLSSEWVAASLLAEAEEANDDLEHLTGTQYETIRRLERERDELKDRLYAVENTVNLLQ